MHQWHPAALGQRTRRGFVAEQFKYLGGWADKTQAAGSAAPGKFGTFGEKTVAGMDSFAVLRQGAVNQLVHIQISRHTTTAQC